VAIRPNQGPAITVREFATEEDEAKAIAEEISSMTPRDWGSSAVLSRNRAVLQPVQAALRELSVKAFIQSRRDRFISPQFVWLQSLLDQSLRPTDRQVFTTMAQAANRMAGLELDIALLTAEAEAVGKTFLEYWALALGASENPIAVDWLNLLNAWWNQGLLGVE